EQAFPLVRKLIGSRKFDGLALAFVRRHPPDTPLMMYYGAELPAFIEGFTPLSQIGYLADAARLDHAMRLSYHAADAPALTAGSIAQVPPEDLMAAHLGLMPSTRLIRSRWPLHDIWRFNFKDDAPKPRAMAQDVLVTRPEFDPVPHLLPPGAAHWLEELQAGRTLGAAYDITSRSLPDFDLSAALTLALEARALKALASRD